MVTKKASERCGPWLTSNNTSLANVCYHANLI